MKQKIQMTDTAQGHDQNEKGVTLPAQVYQKDQVYEVGDRLAKNFISMGKAKPLTESKPDAQTLKTSGAPENKMISAPEVAKVLDDAHTSSTQTAKATSGTGLFKRGKRGSK
jgi:hypothetical protein